MSFNTLVFLGFFIAFFFVYWFFLKSKHKLQNLFLMLGSYIFYAKWNYHFLILLIATSGISFIIGNLIYNTESENKKKLYLYIGLIQAIGILIFFKYFNFFIDSTVDLLLLFNLKVSVQHLNIILPLGISFFSLKLISYLLDIYNEKIKPAVHWSSFFTYIAFFPTLVAGPIDSAKSLISQIESKRHFEYKKAIDALRQILWGMFKKVVIADNCLSYTDYVFNNVEILPAGTLIFGAFLYIVQLYADFSGYSDMAIGIARLIGFNITKNFNFPFFAQNIAEFWRKWHISLTAWMTEYVYTPLSFIFRRQGKLGLILAILINFTLVGLWHGPNWTYIIYGLLHGCYFIPLIYKGTFLNTPLSIVNNNTTSTFKQVLNRILTFLLVMFTAIIFRSETLTQAFTFFGCLFSSSLLKFQPFVTINVNISIILLFILFMFVIEWIQRDKNHGLEVSIELGNDQNGTHIISKSLLRKLFYFLLVIIIFLFGVKGAQFIYQQF